MTIVAVPPQPEKRSRAVAKRGNGKTVPERVRQLENRRLVAQAELELQAEKARAEIAVQNATRREAAAERIIKTYDQQEEKRAPQFQIDQKGTLYLLVGLAIVMFLATAALTADGTIGSAGAAQFISPVLGFILFGAFEVGILVFLLLYYMRGSRINIVTGERVSSIQWFWAAVAVSVLTVSLSAYHVLDLYEYDWTSIDMYVGIGIRLAVSILFVLISKGIAGVLFAQALDLNDLEKIGAVRG